MPSTQTFLSSDEAIVLSEFFYRFSKTDQLDLENNAEY